MTAPLSEVVCGLLTVLGGGGSEGELFIAARSADGFGHATVGLPRVAHRWVPPAILKLLAEHGWSIHVHPAVRAGAGARHPHGTVLELPVLTARWYFPRVYRNEAGVEGGPGSRHVAPRERAQAVAQRVLETLPPTYLVNSAGHELHAVWALDTPLDLRTESGVATARAHRRTLAEALDATPLREAEDLAAVDLPLPGGLVREPPYHEDVTCVHADPARVYTSAALARTLQEIRHATA